MSLDTLFHQILLTEEVVSKKTKRLQDVKAGIIKYQEKIKETTEELNRAKNQLEEKSRVLSELMLQMDLLKKSSEGREKQRDELLEQQRRMKENSKEIRCKVAQERDRFMEEIMSFNAEFNLLEDRKGVVENRTRAEIQALDREEESLNKEMEIMVQEHPALTSLQEKKTALQEELTQLEAQARDLDTQLGEAKAVTECLEAERESAIQRPVTDSVFLRLKSEIRELKDGELSHVREALRSEIQLLKKRLSQGATQSSSFS